MPNEREDAVRAELTAEQERVMNESRPTPSQAEVDGIVLGTMNHDDKVDPENPEMSPLHEQRARMAEAGERPLYRTRQMRAGRVNQDRGAAEAKAEAERAAQAKADAERAEEAARTAPLARGEPAKTPDAPKS